MPTVLSKMINYINIFDLSNSGRRLRSLCQISYMQQKEVFYLILKGQ